MEITRSTLGAKGGGNDSPKRSDVWFDDGNVILQAGDTQFKVHRSVLMKHSPIFGDVFAMPHPKDEPLVDSCPVVRLHDSPQDIKHLILALYGDENYNTLDPVAFEIMAAMIRMGRKYEIKHLRDQGLLRLTRKYPSTLADWDKQLEETIHAGKAKVLEVINLALENDIQTVLPLAYYIYTRDLELGLILNGKIQSDGSIKFQVPGEVVKQCTWGRRNLLRNIPHGVFSWLKLMGDADCLEPDKCREISNEETRDLWRYNPDISVTFVRADLFKRAKISERFCTPCREVAIAVYTEERQAAWDRLPEDFGLGPWANLQDFGG